MTPADEPVAFRERLRHDLRAAMKERRREAVSALRTLIAAIDNAEAARPGTGSPRSAGGVIAQSSPGVGSTEVPRRLLTAEDVRAIVDDLVAEYETQAKQYGSMRQEDAAERLRRAADVLRAYS
ncbi:GatB/YqeY domain-containing protein [Mycolicibacterium litorale]|uniref:Uncharacterized protein n=1 Tax=Mycolicibacterium litorale TaxID=758802 RepID=A0AAD1MVQ1_9MYCO|nr:hypothetical protein [Mycolicibacterium litorale]TDY06751.1 hypothetical protein BCL50_3082 [Mycolicibacterium litorale]BBY19095.1 hypothetical protein MLIT_46870 [Mycolicibacterium litorale]